ncbi:MAG: winged helix-turn-helix domain-containing protein, partial [Candidatus Eremiobacteraeota bacterium]|nr:winged helix-turn-helix domain-containing protein [Candidatus Eremiobacteraeota bacterium]
QPKIVVLIAPAGFGKSTLARQFVSESERSAICDVAGVMDDLDLARRLLPALAIEDPACTVELSQRELMLGDGGTSVADRVNLALEAWRAPTSSAAFVFENAEHVAGSASAREFFGRLMALRPEGRTVVICSRENLRLHLTRFAPPHQIMTLRAADLAFDRDEIRQIFEPFTQSAQIVDRIAQTSQGWPIAVFLLKRFAQEGRIEMLLQKLDDVAFEELHDYLADQVLSSLCRELADAVFACAAIPSAKLEDLRIAFHNKDVLDALEDFAKESPFVKRREDGAFIVHPLLAAQLLEQHEERRGPLLEQIAQGHVEARNYPRAAELELARGDQAAAAEALSKHEVIRDHAPSMEYARVLASLDRSLVQSYPRLWGVTALMRMFCAPTEELLEEAEALWRTLPAEASPLECFYVLLFRLLFMSYMGLFEEAEQLLDDFARENAAVDSGGIFEAYILYFKGLFEARTGHIVQAEHNLTMALPHISGMDVMMSGTLLTLGADIARVRGEFAVARQFIDRAIAAAKRSTLFNFVAFDYAEASFGAWFTGDDAAFGKYVQRLDEVVARNGVHGFAYFTAIAAGRTAEPKEPDLLKWVVCGQLIAAARAGSAQQALRLAKSALVNAELHRTPFLECIAAVAVAVFEDAQYDECIAIAEAAAARCESHRLQAAVQALKSRTADLGMLAAFVSHLRREHAERIPVLDVSLTSGAVRCEGREVTLSERELAVLVALAIREEVVPRARLADLLWPDVDEYAARNALSVTLHRLRQHLGC